MANIKSQIKRNRQNEKRRLRNKAVRSEMKTRTKRAENLAAERREARAEREDAGEQPGLVHASRTSCLPRFSLRRRRRKARGICSMPSRTRSALSTSMVKST